VEVRTGGHDEPVPDDTSGADVAPLANGGGAAGAAARVVPWVLVLLAGAYGILLRVWLLAHLPLFGDEAVVGLMGRGILSGRLDAFYWGQHYGGVEPYVVAAVLGPVNGGPTGLNATPTVLAAAASGLAYVVLRTAHANRRLAGVGAAMVWVWPYAATWNSVREIGFRGITLCCGLVLVLCALRVHRHRAGPTTLVVLGLAAGTGWWASPEIAYFVIPALVLLLASWSRLSTPAAGSAPRWSAPWHLVPVLLTAVGVVVGALPWLYSNARTGFASLDLGRPAPPQFGYWARVTIFFGHVLPTQLGLRTVPRGAWLGGSTVGHALYVVVLAVLVVILARTVWVARLGRVAAPLLAAGLAVVAFPFVYALFPTSWYWRDARYGVYLPPLIVLLAVWSLPGVIVTPSVAGTHARRRRTASPGRTAVAVASLGLAAGICSTVALAHESTGVPTQPRAFFAKWSDPNEAARQVVRSMVAHHLRTAYGDYWTSYDLDFLAPHSVTVSPSPLDVQRSAGLARAVRRGSPQAWLFFAPGREAEARAAFSNPEPGPGGYSEGAFTTYLTARRNRFRVVHLGILDAVVPEHPVRRLPPP
jgi:hypothetical protein